MFHLTCNFHSGSFVVSIFLTCASSQESSANSLSAGANHGTFFNLLFIELISLSTHGAFFVSNHSWYFVWFRLFLMLCNSSTVSSVLLFSVSITSLNLDCNAFFASVERFAMAEFAMSNLSFHTSSTQAHCEDNPSSTSSLISLTSYLVGLLYACWYIFPACDFSSAISSIICIMSACKVSLLTFHSSICLMMSALSFIILTVCGSNQFHAHTNLSVVLTPVDLLGFDMTSAAFWYHLAAHAKVRAYGSAAFHIFDISSHILASLAHHPAFAQNLSSVPHHSITPAMSEITPNGSSVMVLAMFSVVQYLSYKAFPTASAIFSLLSMTLAIVPRTHHFLFILSIATATFSSTSFVKAERIHLPMLVHTQPAIWSNHLPTSIGSIAILATSDTTLIAEDGTLPIIFQAFGAPLSVFGLYGKVGFNLPNFSVHKIDRSSIAPGIHLTAVFGDCLPCEDRSCIISSSV